MIDVTIIANNNPNQSLSFIKPNHQSDLTYQIILYSSHLWRTERWQSEVALDMSLLGVSSSRRLVGKTCKCNLDQSWATTSHHHLPWTLTSSQNDHPNQKPGTDSWGKKSVTKNTRGKWGKEWTPSWPLHFETQSDRENVRTSENLPHIVFPLPGRIIHSDLL